MADRLTGHTQSMSDRVMPSGRVTMLFSDIEGSTRLLMSLGDAYAEVLAEHQRLLRTAIAAFHGFEVSTEGDSFFVVFREASQAVAAAADAQRSIASHAWPLSGSVRVRMGIHSGRAVPTSAGYVGIDVHRAARIADAGHGGQVLVSESAVAASAGSLPRGVTIEDLGRHRLKDVGVERLWQLRVDNLPNAFGPLRSLEAHPTNLPAEADELFGRERECLELAELLATARIVTVTGPGGTGKSRLAGRVAREAISNFPDGVIYVDLALFDDAEIAAGALADVLGVQPSATARTADLIVDHLQGRLALLLLDTAERVAGIDRLIGAIGQHCAGIRVLVTSRAPLRLSLEREYQLGPLSVDTGGGDGRSPAAELFLDRARAARPDLILDAEAITTAQAICERLEGLPLAIELAAARVRLLSLSAMLGRLSRALPLLAGGRSDAPSRQRTLRETIDWSVGLLDAPDRAAMERLAVFVSSFDLDGAAAVTGLDEYEALAAVERLVGVSLLAIVPGDDPRFRFHRLVREYALDALAAADPGDDVRRRYARYWLADVRRRDLELEGPTADAAVTSLRRDQEDLRAVVDWAIEVAPSDPDLADVAVALSGSLGRYWWMTSRALEGLARLEQALGVGAASDPADQARAVYWSGVLADELGRTAEADRQLTMALALYQDIDDGLGVARTLNSLGVVARSLDDPDRAERLLMESLDLKRMLPGQPSMAATLGNLAIVASDRGDDARAIELFEAAIAADEASGSVGAAAFTRLDIGVVRIWSGDATRGVGEIEAVLPTLLELDAEDVIAAGLVALADVAATRGEPARAARLLFVADKLRVRTAITMQAVEEARVERTRATIEGMLDAAELATARADAAAMDAAAAVAYARAGDPPTERSLAQT